MKKLSPELQRSLSVIAALYIAIATTYLPIPIRGLPLLPGKWDHMATEAKIAYLILPLAVLGLNNLTDQIAKQFRKK